jgi:hypothetical protein
MADAPGAATNAFAIMISFFTRRRFGTSLVH